MRRPVPLLAVAAGLAAAAPSASADAPAVAPAPVPLTARVSACAAGDATFTASMPAVGGTRRMAMRFDLRRRVTTADGEVVDTVDVPGWDAWVRSAPDVPGFVFDRRLQNLAAGADYAVAVRFRWTGRGGRVLRNARRVSPFCAQPDPGAGLLVGRLAAGAQDDHRAVPYVFNVRNVGEEDADPGAATVTFAGAAPMTVPVRPLPAGARRRVTFTAAPCLPGSVVAIALGDAPAVTRGCPAT